MRHSRVLVSAMFAALTALTLTACAPTQPGGESDTSTGSAPQVQESTTAVSADQFLEKHDLAGMNATEVIDTLEAMPVAERPTNLMASVRSTELVLLDDENNETSLPLPDDAFYVSVAPYAGQTHDCFFHSLTTCRGEMANESVQITVVADDGTEVMSGTYVAADNGFVGLWLPRDISGTITIVAGEKSVTAPIATGDDDPTCVTTLQLA